MRIPLKFFLCCTALALLPAARGDDEHPAAKPEKPEAVQIKHAANGETVLVLDEPTQKRIGLTVVNPVSAEWQPEIPAIGRVVDPLVFTAAVADYESTRAAATASQAELERTKKLAEQENASPRVLEAAQAAAARDGFALQSAKAKFTSDWGVKLTAQTNLPALAVQLRAGDVELAKLSLPGGVFPKPLPATAQISIFNQPDDSVSGELADDLGIDPTSQVQTLLFWVKTNLPPSIAVTARLKISSEPIKGVTVPAAAVLRYETKGWVFLQTSPTEFSRREISLNRAVTGGFFCTEISADAHIVVTGAQVLLSAEVNGGKSDLDNHD
jgi:hypothetical protein